MRDGAAVQVRLRGNVYAATTEVLGEEGGLTLVEAHLKEERLSILWQSSMRERGILWAKTTRPHVLLSNVLSTRSCATLPTRLAVRCDDPPCWAQKRENL